VSDLLALAQHNFGLVVTAFSTWVTFTSSGQKDEWPMRYSCRLKKLKIINNDHITTAYTLAGNAVCNAKT